MAGQSSCPAAANEYALARVSIRLSLSILVGRCGALWFNLKPVENLEGRRFGQRVRNAFAYQLHYTALLALWNAISATPSPHFVYPHRAICNAKKINEDFWALYHAFII